MFASLAQAIERLPTLTRLARVSAGNERQTKRFGQTVLTNIANISSRLCLHVGVDLVHSRGKLLLNFKTCSAHYSVAKCRIFDR